MWLRSHAVVLSVLLLTWTGLANALFPGLLPHHVEGGFRNPDPAFTHPGGWVRVRFIARRLWTSIAPARRVSFPREFNDGRALRENQSEATVTWIGHSTLLVQIDGVNLLTDPHWGERIGPVHWFGPRRLSAPGLDFKDLPRIHLVLISHDHYDHLDLRTVKRLKQAHDPLFLVPLGLKEWFAENAISRVEELDWWQGREHHGLRLICAPAQHFSGRSVSDDNRRLWSSWVVVGRTKRLYFAGDSGYFGGFKEVGDAFGPFDLAALPIGAYQPASMMKHVHTTPEGAVQAFMDLRGRTLLGIHWGTFDLAEEPLDEPPWRMHEEAKRRAIEPERIWILKFGETRRW